MVVPHKVLSVMSLKDHFYLATPGDIYEAKTVILAPGVAHGKGLTGEADYLGRGISYCATCDGNFYKGKHIGVITTLESGWEEVLFLASLAAEVDVWATYPVPAFTEKNIRIRTGKPTAVEGGEKVTALKTTEGTEPVDGIFILRETDPLEKLLPGLKLDGRFIAVNRQMATSVDGVFAAGDCTGLPGRSTRRRGRAGGPALCGFVAPGAPAMTGERRLQAGLLAALLAASLLTGCGSSTGSQSTASSKGTEAASTQENF